MRETALIITSIAVAVLGVVTLTTGAVSVPPVSLEPFPFNHLIHADSGLECDDCHQQVFDTPFAGLPRVDLCMDCHEDDIIENASAQPYVDELRRHARAGTQLVWPRLYQLPHHVYYSHRRHVAIAELECSTCHGDIGESEVPPLRPIAATLDMDNCMDCHAQTGVEDDCAWCHR